MKKEFFIIIFLFSIIPMHCSAQKKADISNVQIDHNYERNGKKGLLIHTHFNVEGMKGKKVDCTAYFFDSSKKNLLTEYSGYRTTTGKACTWNYGDVTYDNSEWKDFKLFMPYEALNLTPGTHQYYCSVYIIDDDNVILTKSDYYGFTGTGSNKRRVNNSDGSYVDITYNSDGSITRVTYSNCTICNGHKSCKLCSGAGGEWGGYGAYMNYVICRSCGGSGKCKYCSGTGTNIFTSTYFPSTNETIGQDFWSGNMYSSGSSYHENSNSSNSSSSNKSKCSNCNGTGVDPFAWTNDGHNAVGTGQLRGIYTHTSGGKCQYCGKYEWHQHARCAFCNP